jgi:sulfotransferase family protein
LSIYEVVEVNLFPERHERLLGFEVDVPKVGTRHQAYTLHMIGWTLGRDARAVSVELFHDGEFIRSVPVRGPRDDVSAAMNVAPDTDCVFHLLFGLIGLKLDATLDLAVRLEDGSGVPVGSIEIDRKPLRPDYEPRLQPLILSTLGRSGSTWLMQMLAAHPEVVVFRRFPYESTPAKYWLHTLRVISEPVNIIQSGDAKTSHTNLWQVGNNPHHDDRVYEQLPLANWFGHEHVERLAAFCQRTIDDWYMTLARTQLQAGPVYFAEKHVSPNYLPSLIWELYPRAKEVFLVRDFRDMAQSIMAFDAKRGFAGFGRPDGVSDEQYLHGELRRMAQDLTRDWVERRDRAHLVRYEDLVYQPVETLTGMLQYLELDASPETMQEVLAKGSEQVLDLPGSGYELAEIQAHRTISDPRETIGRWHRDGGAPFQALVNEVLGDALREFGYA